MYLSFFWQYNYQPRLVLVFYTPQMQEKQTSEHYF